MGIEERRGLAKVIEYLTKVLFENLPESDMCYCEESESFHIVHHGNLFDELHYYCLKCGGLIEDGWNHSPT